MPISEQRRTLVERARQEWISRLIDVSRRNNLLYYRPLKTGNLELSLVESTRMAALLSGEKVPISKLLDERTDERLTGSLREIWRRAQANAEEKGLGTLFITIGMATWTAPDGGRDPDAPVLLLPVILESKGTLGQAFSIRRTGTVQVNLVLLHVLESELGIRLTPEDLLPLLQGDDEGELFDPSPVYKYLIKKCGGVPGFQVKNSAVLGNFTFQKMAMVNDLRERGDDLVANDLIAALAGDGEARKQVSAQNVEPNPREFDRCPPQDEFLILDADSSQQKAIAAVLKGQSAVIHGPPGTGKSQTIANLISSLAVAGRRVLFVAEKRAALEVVKKRLTQVGLKHIAIDMHGADVSPKNVLEQVAAALEAIRSSVPTDYEAMHKRFMERRERLNRHAERLHIKRAPGGHTVYELQGRVLTLQRSITSITRWRGAELQRIADAGTSSVRDLLKEAEGFASLFLRSDSSPWTGSRLRDGGSVQKAVDLVIRLATQTWPEFKTALAAVLEMTRFKQPANTKEARLMFSLLADVQGTLSLYSGELYAQNLQKLLIDLAPGRDGKLAAAWAFCTNGTFRHARRQVLALRTAGKATVNQIYSELSAAESERTRWAQFLPAALLPKQWGDRSSLPKLVPAFQKHVQKLDALLIDLKQLEVSVPKKDLLAIPLDEIRSYVESLSEDTLTPHRLPKLWEIEQGLENAGAGRLVAEIRSTNLPPDLWEQLFDQAWYASCLDAALAQEQEIAGFNGRTHDKFVREFADLDKERIRVAVARVKRAYAESAIAVMNANPKQEFLVRGEAQKKSRHLPLRKLFAQAHDVLTAICPCWMASPLSVSQLLDGTQAFDVIIFDEASQVLPEDAVPAILRGSSLVVAGDSKQLPPTTFFAAADDDSAQEEEASATEGFESLLDMANTFISSSYLNWHYRSRDESLIAFSNHHVYKDRLVTFPGPGGSPAVKHVLANQQPGLDGQEESSSAEVQAVVQLILGHAKEHPEESLGVIAMGIKHSDRVQRALDEALEEHPELDSFFDQESQERFFVKNLERVQGDERDAIILTVGYGKDRGGNLPFRFGPLLSEGGQRRLNVAVTRARQRMTVVSSFSHLDMDLGRVRPGTGVELLRYYLQYAASGGRRLADAAPTDYPLNEFEAEVYDVLQSKGIPLIPQVGASRFRIDLVAKHPTEPGRFVLAIECDGASYHSSPTARDRDRLRQQQLENLGWRFHRIWSTDWFMRKDEEIQRALAAYKKAVEALDTHGSSNKPRSPSEEIPDMKVGKPNASPTRGARPRVPSYDSIAEYTDGELLELINWLNSDGRLRTDDEMIDELVPELGFARRGARIEAVLRELLYRAKPHSGPDL